jgi:outer membrane protein TolC
LKPSALRAAEETVKSAGRLAEAGEATSLELSEASVNLSQAKNQHQAAELRLTKSKIDLLFRLRKISDLACLVSN